jgi:plastocyanin
MDIVPPALTIAVGDSITFETRGYTHILFFSPGPVAFFDGPTLTYVPPFYSGPSQVTDPTGVYSGGPTWSGDSYTFTFPTVGTFDAFCGYHPAMKFTATVQATATTTVAAEDTRRENLIDSMVAAVPVISTTGTAPSVANSDGSRTYTVTVGASRVNPAATFHKFIPSALSIQVGDSVTFTIDDHTDIRPLAINSSGVFQPTFPLVGGTVLETSTTPGGRMMEQPFYLAASGVAPSDYTTGFISSGWMGALDFPEFPGIGKLPSTWTVTFNQAGTFNFRDTVGGWCPPYAGDDCVPTMRGTITVKEASSPNPSPEPSPEPSPDDSSANTLILSMWALLVVFFSYF